MLDPLGQPCADGRAQVVTIRGPDAVAFAHAQFSSNVNALAVGQWQFSAWLDAAARVRAFFHLAHIEDGSLLLLLRGADATGLAGELSRLVFRRRAAIAPDTSFTLATGAPLPLHAAAAGPTGIALGCGSHALRLQVQSPGDDDWHRNQLQAGWPWLPPGTSGRWLAPALSLERLGATVLGKGCYPGQEVIARIHFRGAVKRHLCLVALSGATAPDKGQASAPATADRRILGPVVVDGGTQALAVLEDSIADVQPSGHPTGTDTPTGLRILHRWPA